MKHFSSRLFAGVLLVALGVFFILDRMGVIDFSLGYLISTYWPVILLISGLKMLSDRRGSQGLVGPFIVLGIGIYFQGRNLGWFYLSPGDFFKFLIPGLFICCGLYVLFRPRRADQERPVSPEPPFDRRDIRPLDEEFGKAGLSLDEQFEQTFGKMGPDAKTNPLDAPDYEDDGDDRYRDRRNRSEHREDPRHRKEWAEGWDHKHRHSGDKVNKSTFIGDFHLGHEDFQLKNTNVSQFIGDTVIDLTKAQIPYGKTKINISAFIGDVKVFIPDDMDLGIKVNTSSFIGDMSVLNEKRSGFMSSSQVVSSFYKEADKKIILNISAFIGDIRVNKVG
ncbi:cell wall-active antibiotics response protein LiaF [Paenibacillus sp. JX-17]|uniref:Cell wall-active antibiotics response protein LiaF n=1 Tax=Paenibacillus lacisoli TaxID=3064525 RepID=A0ABT9CDM7_9BACL|nr:cell wall-active antibiotics response protein LiaF [Paenibacillus sp. JX-17]MDO7907367.1 cell wall-active antibiotics response protein LiaF [Paenibacillus sp. JX-17]